MKIHKLAFILLIIGGLNWLLVGLVGWDVGELFGGQGAIVPRIIYILVGIAALSELFSHKKTCRACEMPRGPSMGGTPQM